MMTFEVAAMVSNQGNPFTDPDDNDRQTWECEERILVALSEIDALKSQITDWNRRGAQASEDCVRVKAQFYYDRCRRLADDVTAVLAEAKRLGLSHPMLAQLTRGHEYLRIQLIVTPDQLRKTLLDVQLGKFQTIEEFRRELRSRAR
jgi:hypothetical protein